VRQLRVDVTLDIMFDKDRREKLESVVARRRVPKNTRRHTISMSRMFFKRNAIEAMLSSFVAVRL